MKSPELKKSINSYRKVEKENGLRQKITDNKKLGKTQSKVIDMLRM